MKIAIIGSSGQIGMTLYEALHKKHEVTGTSRKSSARYLEFDPFKDHWSVLGRPEVIINCVGQIDSTRTFSFTKIHLELVKLLIKNRGLLGNPRIIQISALGASADHAVEFLRTKGQADDYLLQFPDAVVVRPSIVCTHRTMTVRKMLMLYQISRWIFGTVIGPKGFFERKIQPVMPQDLAAIVDQLCSASPLPKILNVPGPDRLTFHEIIALLFRARNKKYHVLQVPKPWTDLLVKYAVNSLFPEVINAQQYALLFKDNVADPREAEKYLGRPLTSTKDFWTKEFNKYARH